MFNHQLLALFSNRLFSHKIRLEVVFSDDNSISKLSKRLCLDFQFRHQITRMRTIVFECLTRIDTSSFSLWRKIDIVNTYGVASQRIDHHFLTFRQFENLHFVIINTGLGIRNVHGDPERPIFPFQSNFLRIHTFMFTRLFDWISRFARRLPLAKMCHALFSGHERELHPGKDRSRKRIQITSFSCKSEKHRKTQNSPLVFCWALYTRWRWWRSE